jgi:hypothetical protein
MRSSQNLDEDFLLDSKDPWLQPGEVVSEVVAGEVALFSPRMTKPFPASRINLSGSGTFNFFAQ